MLRFAHLADAAEPLILIWGDTVSLEGFATLLEHGRGATTLVDTLGSTEIALEVGDAGGGVSQVSESAFRWSINAEDRRHFADLVRVVAASTTPCHHYLDDAGAGGLAVTVSKGEYPDDFRV